MEGKYIARTKLEKQLLMKKYVNRCDLCFQERDLKKKYPLPTPRVDVDVHGCGLCGQEVQVKRYILLMIL